MIDSGVAQGQAPVEVQAVAPWEGLHRLSISALKYLGPVSRADPAKGRVQLYYF